MGSLEHQSGKWEPPPLSRFALGVWLLLEVEANLRCLRARSHKVRPVERRHP